MSVRLLVTVALVATIVGCNQSGPGTFTQVGSTIGTTASAPKMAAGIAPAADAAPAAPVARKVIFTANLDLKVDDAEQAVAKLRTLVGQMGGYVSKSEVSGSPGARTATLTARLPVKQFPAAVEQFSTLGSVTRSASDSQDVTEEFIDAEARLKNYKAEEVALNKLLESSGGRLDDIFKIREQILRNRAEVERIEGRLKYLGDRTELSTLTLTMREEKAPGPPPPPPTFSNRLSETFFQSLDKLREFAEELVLFLVAVAPWLPVLLVLGWLTLVVLRKLMAPPRRKVVVATRLPDLAVTPTAPAAEPGPADGEKHSD